MKKEDFIRQTETFRDRAIILRDETKQRMEEGAGWLDAQLGSLERHIEHLNQQIAYAETT